LYKREEFLEVLEKYLSVGREIDRPYEINSGV